MKIFPTLLLGTITCALVLLVFDTRSVSSVFVKNPVQSVTVKPGDEKVDVDFWLRSNKDQMSITHVETNCDCAVFSSLPFSLNRENRKISATIDVGACQGLQWPRLDSKGQ